MMICLSLTMSVISGAGGYGVPPAAAAARGRGRGRGAFGNTETPGFMGQKVVQMLAFLLAQL